MSNVLFAFPNRSDAAAVTLSGGSWTTSLPLTNLQDRRLARVARSADASLTSTQFDVDLGTELYLRVAALPGSGQLSTASKWRIRGSSDNTFADASLTVFDSGFVDIYPIIYPSGVLNFGDPGWFDGKLAIVDYTNTGYRVEPQIIISPIATAQYWRVEIDDTANSDGYVDLGRLFLSYAYEPTVNMRNGFSFGWETSSTVTETDGGASYHNDRPRRRLMEFIIPQLPQNEALVRGFEMLRQLGTSGQLYIVFDADDTEHMGRRAYLGTLADLDPLKFPYNARADQGFAVREEL